MKKIKIAFLSLLATCTIASCDFLEKEPYKIVPENYFQNEAEAQSFLTGIYSNLGQSTFYGGDYMVLAGGDDLEFYGGSTGRISNTGLICNNTTTSDAAVTNLWLNLYNGIERANMFLEQIDNVPGMPFAIQIGSSFLTCVLLLYVGAVLGRCAVQDGVYLFVRDGD